MVGLHTLLITKGLKNWKTDIQSKTVYIIRFDFGVLQTRGCCQYSKQEDNISKYQQSYLMN